MLFSKGLRSFLKIPIRNCRNIAGVISNQNASERIFSGIQPTGSVHLGNYLGAIDQWIKMQESGENVTISIVDLHAMTLPFDPKELSKNILEMTATLLACGIDPNKSTLFQQSNVHQHTELWRYMRGISTMARLAHLPQFKTKSSTLENIPLALYFYPILQSADILLYKTTRVPVGEDQLQHIQLCRELARMFNKRYGRTFPIPEAIISGDSVSKVKSLKEPSKKMSKSDYDADSRICLTDSPDDIVRKIMGAFCDDRCNITTSLEDRQEIANLVFIHSMLSNKSVETICAENEGLEMPRYKSLLAECIIEHLTPIRTKLLHFIANPDYLVDVLGSGAKKASAVAEVTMQEVLTKLGHTNFHIKSNSDSVKKTDVITSKDRVFLGLQSTSNFHLGNYLDAIAPCVKLQNLRNNTMISIEDFTTPCDPKEHKRNILKTTATLLACGIDPTKSVLFQQSHIYQHDEMCWHATCIATMARLSQLPQFKDLDLEDIPMELFMHPISQSVDLLLFKTTHVPVGGYQVEHLQLAQEIAKMFNERYGLTFSIPRPIVFDGTQIFKIKDLKDPSKEMTSCDLNPKSVIYLTDKPDVVVKKIKGAVSDFNSKITFEPETRPGVSNLVLVHSLLTGKSIEEIVKDCEGLDTLKYKLQLAECVIEHLNPIRQKSLDYLENPDYLTKVLKDGAEKASCVAYVTIQEISSKLGLQFEDMRNNKKKVVL